MSTFNYFLDAVVKPRDDIESSFRSTQQFLLAMTGKQSIIYNICKSSE
ncbi:MAG TPA: palindromic element RPE4 domain-containing protein [Rickettsia endosymbiont of Degeeriella rufa]|nr:palindromic element RPE4 domain-containing protein [Rickettsia endosymbiont of Degeeriella rufa]